jgi:hypothetical protein
MTRLWCALDGCIEKISSISARENPRLNLRPHCSQSHLHVGLGCSSRKRGVNRVVVDVGVNARVLA